MTTSLEDVVRRQVRLERELSLWRLVIVILAAVGLLAAAGPQGEKEIRFNNGTHTVTVSAEGMTLQSGNRVLANLTFETVGDGDEEIALLKMTGEVNVESGIISVGSFPKQRAAIRPDGFSLLQEGIIRAGMNPGLLTLTGNSGHTKADLTADDEGLTGLSLSHNQKLIAQLASAGRFVVTNPPKRDSANLMLNDWGSEFKSRLITPSGDTASGK